jgi:hypothetical protein
LNLVIDASVAVAAAANPLGFGRFRRFELRCYDNRSGESF